MPVARRAHLPIIGVAALLCLDAALIAFGWMTLADDALTDDPVADKDWSPPRLDAPPTATARSSTSAQADPILMRPIFFASRKPFEPPPARAASPPPAGPKPPPADSDLVLDGIVLTGKARKAHLRKPTDADGRWQEAGQVIDGWTVAEIDAAGVVLEQAGHRLQIRLYPSDPHAFRMERLSSRPRKTR